MDGTWPVVKVNDMVPYFANESTRGRTISPWDYRGRKNLVLVFFHGPDCAACMVLLNQFAQHYGDYRDLNTEILGVSRSSIARLTALAREMNLPFPLVADPDGSAIDKFIGQSQNDHAAVFITDRYGALYTQAASADETALPDQDEILDWLLFIEVQCPECGTPEWTV